MASPGGSRTDRPLDTLNFDASGPPAIMGVVTDHLRRLGARTRTAVPPASSVGHLTLAGPGFVPVEASVRWSERPGGAVDEATAQAVSGIMAVHGRRHGAPRGIAADFVSTATAVLTVQGLLAALLGQARGGTTRRAATRADHAALLTVSQYLAAAAAEDSEATELAPGGPPFTSADDVHFELETLDPGAWAAFWRALDAPAEAIRAGWRPFQFRYATACAPLPEALHHTARATSWPALRAAADSSGAQVCRLRSLRERAAEDTGATPWSLRPAHPASHRPGQAAPPADLPLAGLTVLEAGRRIQGPLAAHLLGMLGADVIRIEPPGGDPLRGMPPTCSGVSARWLALNRGKRAVEIDIKAESGRRQLLDLVSGADVFLHNWAPGKAAELGLDSDDLARVRPSLVYAYTSGWAGRLRTPPMGTDFMVQARTGVGEAVRPEGEVPAPSLMTLLDVLGGMLGTETVLAALLLRERTGCGVRAESSLLGAADVLTAPALSRLAQGREHRSRPGFRRPLQTADGWVAVADEQVAEPPAGLDKLPTSEALATVTGRGTPAVAVTTDLARIADDPHFAGLVSNDSHGAIALSTPWSLT
ncbi:CoA transferase [Streptomyces bohaiensis]|uniref:CoA transferase n=1 Tax=Streptomyces bohaiensis TaxID=1431344 RepID=A0ABX1C357_9ACTN|nr:CoA transferase [Streptomyces bohaiensis]NJQ13656.1 CoA transferase [Streptomyces bohaiensis]